jgi:hypothetical protein
MTATGRSIADELKTKVFDGYKRLLEDRDEEFDHIGEYLHTFSTPDAPNNNHYKMSEGSSDGGVDIDLVDDTGRTSNLIMTIDGEAIHLFLNQYRENYSVFASKNRKKWYPIFETTEESRKRNATMNRRKHALASYANRLGALNSTRRANKRRRRQTRRN